MNLSLKRNSFNLYGIIGELIDNTGKLVAVTLEHAYPVASGFAPKLPAGTYTCQRGVHALSNGVPFETFEVMNVPGHTGILLHKGNYNKDSEGCILLGSYLGTGCILESAQAFENFMALEQDLQEFTLVVS